MTGLGRCGGVRLRLRSMSVFWPGWRHKEFVGYMNRSLVYRRCGIARSSNRGCGSAVGRFRHMRTYVLSLRKGKQYVAMCHDFHFSGFTRRYLMCFWTTGEARRHVPYEKRVELSLFSFLFFFSPPRELKCSEFVTLSSNCRRRIRYVLFGAGTFVGARIEALVSSLNFVSKGLCLDVLISSLIYQFLFFFVFPSPLEKGQHSIRPPSFREPSFSPSCSSWVGPRMG